MERLAGCIRATAGILACWLVIGDLASAQGIVLSGPSVPFGSVDSFSISADGRWAVYLADQDTHTVPELYSVPLHRRAPATKLSTGPVSDYQFLPNSNRVLVRGQPSPQTATRSVTSVAIDDSAPPVGLASETGTKWGVSPDGSTLVVQMIVWTPDFLDFQLFALPADGSGFPTQLTSSANMAHSIRVLRVSPDSTRAVYVEDRDSDEVFELFSVPLDASAAPVRLNGAPVVGGDVGTFDRYVRIAPDSSRVVYFADQDADEVFELYSAPLDGSAPPTKLNPPLVTGGDVLTFEIAPDAGRVVYVADQVVNGKHEVFSVPLDGSGPALVLNGSIANTRDVGTFRISPDSSRVVYLRTMPGGTYHLFSAPIDGSALPTELTPSLGGIHGVRPGWVLADSSRVVYRADGVTDFVDEIFSVPLDGSAEPVRLNEPLGPGGDVQAGFETNDPIAVISPRADRVVYLVYPGNAPQQLFSAALDGRGSAVQESRGGGASALPGSWYQITPDGNRLLYLAANSLYLSYLTPLHLPSR